MEPYAAAMTFSAPALPSPLSRVLDVILQLLATIRDHLLYRRLVVIIALIIALVLAVRVPMPAELPTPPGRADQPLLVARQPRRLPRGTGGLSGVTLCADVEIDNTARQARCSLRRRWRLTGRRLARRPSQRCRRRVRQHGAAHPYIGST